MNQESEAEPNRMMMHHDEQQEEEKEGTKAKHHHHIHHHPSGLAARKWTFSLHFVEKLPRCSFTAA